MYFPLEMIFGGKGKTPLAPKLRMFARTPEISLLQFESETNVEVGIVLFLSVEAPPQLQTELSPQFTDSVALIFGMRDGKSPGLGGHTLN